MNTTINGSTSQAQPRLVTVNEGDLRAHLDQIVTGAVEETLNQLLAPTRRKARSAGRCNCSPIR